MNVMDVWGIWVITATRQKMQVKIVTAKYLKSRKQKEFSAVLLSMDSLVGRSTCHAPPQFSDPRLELFMGCVE